MSNLFEKWTVNESDSAWSWVTLIASTLMLSTSFGFLYNFGIFYARFLKEYKGSKEKTAWVGSIPFCLMFALAWLGSWIITKCGLRKSIISASVLLGGSFLMTSYAQNLDQLFITFSLPFGLAGGVLLVAANIIVIKYFDKRLPLAFGIQGGGSTGAQVGLTYLYIYLLDNFGLKTTLRIISGMSFGICAISALTLFPTNYSTEDKSDTKKGKLRLQKYIAALKSKRFLLFLLVNMIDSFAYSVSGVHQVQLGLEMGLSDTISNQFPVFTSISNAIGRLFSGAVLNFVINNKLNYYKCSVLIVGLVAIIGLSIKSSSLLIAFIWVYAFFDGNLQASIQTTLRYTCGNDGLAESFAILLTAVAIPIMLGPPITGFVVDKTKSYSVFFYLAGVPHLLAFCLVQFLRCFTVQITDEGDQAINERLNENETDVDLPHWQLLHLETPV